MNTEEYTKLSTEDQVSYWIGRMLFGIGKGDLKSEVFRMMDFLQRLGYEVGRKSRIEKEQK